jgi:hypothetical protein
MFTAWSCLAACFYHPSGSPESGDATATTTNAAGASTGASGPTTGGPTTSSSTGGSGASSGVVDAPPVFRGFTVNGSVAPPEVGVPSFVELEAVIDDDHGLSEVEFYDGDVQLDALSGAGEHVFKWRVDSAMNGPHQLRAVAVDTAMQTAESGVVPLSVFMAGGQEVWVDSLPVEDGAAQGVALDEDGDVLVSGTSGPYEFALQMQRLWLRKYTASGDLLWHRDIGPVSAWDVFQIATRGQAIYGITHRYTAQIDDQYSWFFKLDAEGEPLWDHPNDDVQGYYSVLATPAGEALAFVHDAGLRATMRRYASSGELLATETGPKVTLIAEAVIDGTGSVYFSMSLVGSGGSNEILVQKYGPDGVKVWTRPLALAGVELLANNLVANLVHDSVGISCADNNGNRYFAEISSGGDILRDIEALSGQSVRGSDASGGWLVASTAGSLEPLRRHDHDLTPRWTLTAPGTEGIYDVVTDELGYIYTVGLRVPDQAVIRKIIP